VVLLKNFINVFFVPELRKKLLFTLGILVIYRLGNHIPVVGVDVVALQNMLAQGARGLGGLFAYIDLVSGGGLKDSTIFALGIMPYITASIMMQMLGMTVPSLEILLKEGEYGRKIVNQYTRYLALGVSVMQGIGLAFLLESKGLVLTPGWSFRLMFILSLTVGSMFVMWLGEQISIFGIGNGSSMIIFAGIVNRYPDQFLKALYLVMQKELSPFVALFMLVGFVAITACVVFVERGERKIPVQYTRRVVGQRVYGGQSSYIPFKINPAGIMPVILAGAVINIPLFALSMLSERFAIVKWLTEVLNPVGLVFNVIMFVLIICFTFVYTALQFNPDELAENIKKSGGFIPGIRPGKRTADLFCFILTRLGLVGGLYLAGLVLLPSILNLFVAMPIYFSGTALLIVVGVTLETAAQIESYLLENRYEGFLSSGRLQSRLRR
jgi:preprotein translocase subunit SecY